jgi:hypothetical protein
MGRLTPISKPNNLYEMKVNIYRKIDETRNVWSIDFFEVLNIIRTGDLELLGMNGRICSLGELIQKIRNEVPHERLQEYKNSLLPPVCYNGVFDSEGELIQYNDITAIDIDHIGGRARLEEMRQKLIADPHSLAIFETPSGDGLKVIVRHDNRDPERHSDMYKQIMAYYECHDPKCSDLKRRHYLSYDPLLWINPGDVTPFHFDATITEHSKQKAATKPIDHESRRKSDKSIIAMLNSAWSRNHPEYWKEGNRASGVFDCSCQLCKSGVDEELALQYCLDRWLDTGIDEKEIEHNCRGGYKHVRRMGEEGIIQWQ